MKIKIRSHVAGGCSRIVNAISISIVPKIELRKEGIYYSIHQEDVIKVAYFDDTGDLRIEEFKECNIEKA